MATIRQPMIRSWGVFQVMKTMDVTISKIIVTRKMVIGVIS